MTTEVFASDVAILDLLRKRDSLTVVDLAEVMQVTATAVRQRLTRLMGQGLIARKATKAGRGRPSHHYELTPAGRRRTGSNFADLAIALWQEIREIKDLEVRRGLLQRVSKRMATQYADQIRGATFTEKMQSLANLFSDRRMPFEVDTSSDLPVLKTLSCPYPELAEQDRSICAMEKMLFSELVGESLRLEGCRLDGESCCTFKAGNN